MRKFSAFLLSLFTYVLVTFFVILNGSVSDPNLPSFVFQLGVGIAAVSGTFYAANVLTKRTNQDG